MTAIEDERTATEDDVAELLAEIEEAAVGKADAFLPAIIEDYEYDPAGWLRQRYNDALASYGRTAAERRGFWAESPATLGTLKGYIALTAKRRSAGLAKFGEYAYGGVALAACSSVYGSLWLIRKPIATPVDGGNLPSLGHLRSDIRASGTAGRIYGYALVGWTHVIGYGLAWICQRPGRLLTALAFAGAYAVQLFI